MTEKKGTEKGVRGVSWEAEEYVQMEKNWKWYVGLFGVTIGLSAGAAVLGWWSFLVVVVLSAVALLLYSARPPRRLHYSLSNKGISEGERLYPIEEYKSFGVMQEEEHYAVVLTPRKRFAPRTTIYFPKESGEEIVDFFGARLPMEEVRFDFIDKLVRMFRL